jgi:hypothetical protein
VVREVRALGRIVVIGNRGTVEINARHVGKIVLIP